MLTGYVHTYACLADRKPAPDRVQSSCPGLAVCVAVGVIISLMEKERSFIRAHAGQVIYKLISMRKLSDF